MRRRWDLGAFGALAAMGSGLAISAPAIAQDDGYSATAGTFDTNEIIVTAQRREESIQDVPMSIIATGADTLERNNIKSILSIGRLVPALKVDENQGGVTFYIRGIGSNVVSIGNENSNGLYVDGVYFTRVSPITLRLNNVERVEILKGPQGTLFGRNSTSGLIQIVTRDPQPGSTPELRFKAGLDNYETVETSAYVSAGLSDTVAADFSIVYSNQNKGWGTNLFTGEEIFKERSYAMRSKWVFEPGPETRIAATGYYDKGNGDTAAHASYFGPSDARSGYFDGSGEQPLPPGRYDNYSNFKSFTKNRNYGGVLRLEQGLGFADLVSITAYNDYRDILSQDLDQSPLDGFTGYNIGYEKRFTEELQLLSTSSSAIKWTAGLFYMDWRYGYDNIFLSGDLFGGVTLEAPGRGKTKSYAAYAQATAPLTDRLNLTLGGRYSVDDLVASGEVGVQTPNGVVPIQPYDEEDATFRKFIWKATLDYQVSDELMVYATQSRGSKTGAFNLITFDPEPVRPESLDAYEIGFKSQFLDRRLTLNGALFYYKIKDLQVMTNSDLNLVLLRNAAEASVKGAELEAMVRITDGFSINGAATYLDAKYDSYPNAPSFLPSDAAPLFGYNAAISIDAAGNRLTNAPEFAGNIGFLWEVPTEIGIWSLNANYAYSGPFYWKPDNLIRQDNYGVLDARLSYEVEGTGLKLGIWGSNLTNEKYYTYITQFAGPIGDRSMPSAPRRYGFDIEYRY